MKWAKKQTGFTIVELLIVVVVIAILAAITIVAYNGISNRAKNSAAQSAASSAAKKLMAYSVQNSDNFPFDLDTAGLIDTNSTYQYSFDNSGTPRTFCVTATVQNVSYYINNTSAVTPVAGACPSHGINGLPPNLATNPSFETNASTVAVRTNTLANPSFETNTTGWGAVNGGTGASLALSSAQVQSGSNSLLYTYGDGSTGDSGAGGSITAGSAGATYTISAWVYAPASISTGLRMIAYNTAVGSTLRGTTVTTVGSWARVSVTLTTVAAGTLAFAIGKESTSVDTGKLLYIDSVLVEVTNTPTGYFSGATAASSDYTYAWAGTAHASQSQELAANVQNYSQNGSGNVRYRSGVRASSGSYSGRVEITASSTNAGLYQGISLAPGTYTFIAKVWIESGAAMSVTLTSQGTSVTVGATSGYPSSTSTQNQWVELRRSIVVPATTVVNSFVYISGASNAVGMSFWVDEYAVVAGDCTAATCY